MVDQWNVMTVEDLDVCSICGDIAAENPWPLDTDPPPYHVNCRCWLQPILSSEFAPD